MLEFKEKTPEEIKNEALLEQSMGTQQDKESQIFHGISSSGEETSSVEENEVKNPFADQLDEMAADAAADKLLDKLFKK